VTDRTGRAILAELPLLVLEATPVPALVDHLTRLHRRLPDVVATMPLPANVTVVQYAANPNGYTALRDPARLRDVLAEVASERQRMPVSKPQGEAAACFKEHRQQVERLGFAPGQVLTFGGVRGLNTVAEVERLHVVGRPMAPSADVAYLAQVVHHDEAPISAQLELRSRRFGGQPYEVDVVAFVDPRTRRLLEATRDDEINQVIHRARLLTLEAEGDALQGGRGHVCVVLHTGHPVPGLRVDELYVRSMRTDINTERHESAERRIRDAAAALKRDGRKPTVRAVAAAAGAHKSTVTKVLGTPVHTFSDLSNKGMHRRPQTNADVASSTSQPPEAAPPDGGARCLGGCGARVSYDGAKCSPCADAAVAAWRQAPNRPPGGRKAGDDQRL
jgi:hypothetical protein